MALIAPLYHPLAMAIASSLVDAHLASLESAAPTPGEFNPLQLFKAGDLGGFYDPNDIGTLFQTRTGPTVPVTGDWQPVHYIVDLNGQFDLSRATTGDGLVYDQGVLPFDPARSSGQRVNLTSATMAGFAQATVACGGYVNFSEGTPSNNNALISLAMLNTLGTAGLIADMSLRTTGLLRMSLFGGTLVNVPDQPAPPSDEAFFFAAQFDSTASEQTVFLNDDAFPVATPYTPPGSVNFRIQPFLLVGQDVPFAASGPVFFINRLLTPAELAQLNTWMRANTPVPFSPLTLFSPTDRGGVFDIARMELCYQDAAGTVPVTALGQDVLSVRAVNNPSTLLLVHNDTLATPPPVYAEDSQGFPCLQAVELVAPTAMVGSLGGTAALDAWTSIQAYLGPYTGETNGPLGGQTLVGTPGAEDNYGGTYCYDSNTNVYSSVSVYSSSPLETGTVVAPVVENIDSVPFVQTLRVQDGQQSVQTNLEAQIDGSFAVSSAPSPVSTTVAIAASAQWYGGVFIDRWLSDTELVPTQKWVAALAGKTLA